MREKKPEKHVVIDGGTFADVDIVFPKKKRLRIRAGGIVGTTGVTFCGFAYLGAPWFAYLSVSVLAGFAIWRNRAKNSTENGEGAGGI